jgi:hypothetical protein
MSFTVKLQQTISNHDIAEEFVGSTDADQAEMLADMARIVSSWPVPWAMQCRAISDGFERMHVAADRSAVIAFLKELVDHLEDYQPYPRAD